MKSFSANPAIEDRVNAVNVLLLANRMAVHSKCKYLIKSLEQQAYGKNGKPEKMQGASKPDVLDHRLSGPIGRRSRVRERLRISLSAVYVDIMF